MYYTKEQRSLIETFLGNNEEYHMVLESIGELCENEIAPKARELEKKEEFPRKNIEKLFDLGVMKMSFPEKYGGLGYPFLLYIAALEMVSKACASTALSIAIHNTCCNGIFNYGSEEQRLKYLPGLIEGGKIASFALTEANSGSDAGMMETRAELKGSDYVVNGSKMFITNAGEADVYFVIAKTHGKHSAFIVDNGNGVKVSKPMKKMGLKASRTCEVVFEDCHVPKANIVGEEGKGFEYAKLMLNSGRITIGSYSVGIAQAAYEKALKYSKERKQFNQPISNFQAIQFKFADMYTSINASRLMTYYAARLRDMGKQFASQASQAKLHGGYGYLTEYDVERHWRDVKLATIGEGTSEVMKMVISSFELR
ncbi:MAG: acyl-CoA dehydrogenase family protein [Candidatus Aenigmarchaeota archaeon]|nr:acyl-CoA dehydrogenase family protein [Candidatus Aenigmarchaeota archaeon]